ncbi:MAG: restriction endonuclease subunit S, partial [Bacillota bacterium]|nr:restriction endonuclease subunit S [Bacillota bacterium]
EYSPISGSISSAYVMIIPNKEKVFAPFFKWLFKSVGYIKALQSTSDLIRDGQAMRYSNFIQVPLFEAPFEDQKRIANFLDKKCSQIDALISNQEKQIEKLKEYKQSLITEVVTKGLDPNVPMKDSGVEWIEEIPENWSIVPLKTLFDFGKGLPITKENLVEEGIPVISYGQIHAKWNSGVTIHEELKRFVSKEYLETNPSCLVKKGDFIVADTSEDREGCGNAAYVDTDDTIFAGYHTVILISKKSNVDNKYLAYLFLTDAWRSQLRKRVSGIKVFSVSRKFLSEISVLVPDNTSKMIELLEKKCSHIDRLISIKLQKIEKLNQYKKSIIYEYVTGKKEVM